MKILFMIHMKKVILVSFVFLLAGCVPVMRKYYGIRDPGVENNRTIIKKALKFNLDTSNIVTVNSKDFLFLLKKHGIPNGAIYDKNGKYIEYRETDTSCNAGLFKFIPSLNPDNKYNQPDSIDLTAELRKYRNLKGNLVDQPGEADFYFLIYWAIWTGRLNKDHVKIWEDLARKNKNCNIQVIKVNLDMQEYWENEEKEKIVQMMTLKNN